MAPVPSLLEPLRHSGFAVVAVATLVSNVGVWMRDTTSASTVAGEVNGHATVALMQTATTFPMFVLASGASDYGMLLGTIEIGSLGGIGLGLARLAGWRAMAAIIPSSEK